MPNCSGCGRGVEDKAKICPHCARKTRFGSPGLMGIGGLEYLVTFVLIGGVLFAMLYPLFRSARVAAFITGRLSDAKRVDIAVIMYASDSNDRLPPMDSNEQVVATIDKYFDQSEKVQLQELARKCVWDRPVGGVSLNSIQNIAEVWLFYSDQEPRTKNRALAFLDGHVKSANPFVFDHAMEIKPIIDGRVDSGKPSVIRRDTDKKAGIDKSGK